MSDQARMDYSDYLPQKVLVIHPQAEVIVDGISSRLPALSLRAVRPGDDTPSDWCWADTYVGFAHPALRENSLRWVHLCAAGVDAVLQEAWPAEVLLTRSMGRMKHRIAEYCLAHALGLEQGLVRLHGQQQSKLWQPFETRLLRGSNVVVVGTGEIGSEVGHRFACLGCQVAGVSRTGTPRKPFEAVVPLAHSGEILAAAQWIILTLPLTSATRHCFDAQRFAACRGAKLINIGRGAVINEPDLVRALETGQVQAAVLDVFEQEPLPSESPLWGFPQVVVTPHFSGRTAPVEVAEEFAEIAMGLKLGERSRLTVDPTRGY